MDEKIIKVDFEKGKVEKKPNNYQMLYNRKNSYDKTYDTYFQKREVDLDLNEEEQNYFDDLERRSLGDYSLGMYYLDKIHFKLQKLSKFRFIEAFQSENYDKLDIEYYIDMPLKAKKKYNEINNQVRYTLEYDFEDIAHQIKDKTFETYDNENNNLNFDEILVMYTAGVYEKILTNGNLIEEYYGYNYDNAFSDNFDVSFEYYNNWAEILYGKIKASFELECVDMPKSLVGLISTYCNIGSKYVNTIITNDFVEIKQEKIDEDEKNFYRSKKGMLANFIEKGKEISYKYMNPDKSKSK